LTVTAEELNAAALQFVRKISGFHRPSQANQRAFDKAVGEIAAASQSLLDTLVSSNSRATHTAKPP
jgi:hypothetical protein